MMPPGWRLRVSRDTKGGGWAIFCPEAAYGETFDPWARGPAPGNVAHVAIRVAAKAWEAFNARARAAMAP